MSKGNLYLIPTVIAENTEEVVITNQIKNTIRNLDYFLVENIRTARRYISKLQLGLTIENLQFELLDKSTSPIDIKQYLAEVEKGRSAGILSESGCPGVADPGSIAVDIAHRSQIRVIPLVGPSSILMALMGSGFNGQSFTFHGYIPIDKKDRLDKIRSMEKNSRKLNQTQLFMDTPYRNQKLFEDLLFTCHGDTKLSIAKDITGKQELIMTKSISEWKANKININKVPTIFSILA